MTTEMELRVARAIYDEAADNPESGERNEDLRIIACDEQGIVLNLSCVAVARAAIRAMREPTDPMRIAFDNAKYDIVYTETDYGGGGYAALCDGAAERAWTAMIDAATSSEGETTPPQ